jgi:hypothetical protein
VASKEPFGQALAVSLSDSIADARSARNNRHSPMAELSPRYRHIFSPLAPSISRKQLVEFRRFRCKGISMLPEASYLSRFFAKFIEIAAGGLATAMCAYLIAYLGGPLSVATPAPAAVSAGPTEVATSLPAQPAPPVAAAAVDEQRRAPQPVTDAPPAQPARKAEKVAIAVPALRDIKTGTSVARSEKSVEALARAALANVDADRPAPADAPIRRTWTGAGSTASLAVEARQRSAEVPPRQADIQPPLAAAEAALPRRVAILDPLPQDAGSPPEIAAPQLEPPAHQDTGLFSVFKRMPHLLRAGTPPLTGEAPRPPMPVGTASRE